MGKSSKPLVIAAPQWLIDTPEFKKLAEQGHSIVNSDDMDITDLRIGGHCWYFTKAHYDAGLLKLALEHAKGLKYE